MKYILTLLFSVSLYAGESMFLVHAKEGAFTYDRETETGTLELNDVNEYAGVFTTISQRRVGMIPVKELISELEEKPYAMISFTAADGYHSIPLQIEKASDQNGKLFFHVKVLHTLGVFTTPHMGESLLYIDTAEIDKGCFFPGAGYETPACRHKF
ncbi:MAG: hypothetical protein H7A36_01835 [Chlamydiales bacterium]|nr:hypothetical protein [Chlamydiales bacterium]